MASKILCYHYWEKGRDIEIMMPVMYYLERICGYKLIHAHIYDPDAIYRHKPDAVFIANTVGSKMHFTIAQLTNSAGIILLSLISEGNFRSDDTFNFWGWNTDKQFYENYLCCWSNKKADILRQILPVKEKHKAITTGATGFDRYSILQFKNKDWLLNKYKKQSYRKIVGYASWSFGALEFEQGLANLKVFTKNDPNQLQWIREQKKLVQNIIEEIVLSNKDILFVLKSHPGEVHPHKRTVNNEISNLKNLDNVLYFEDEENIHDLINSCDIWSGFETTTALEAWLLHKETFLINPDPDFNRDPNYKGSVIVQNKNTLQSHLDTFFLHHSTTEFISLNEERSKIISDVIGYSDGLNHLRAGIRFNQLLKENHDKKVFYKRSLKNFIFRLSALVGLTFYNKALFHKIPWLRKNIWILDHYNLSYLKNHISNYYHQIDLFYEDNSLKKKLKDNKFIQNLLSE